MQQKKKKSLEASLPILIGILFGLIITSASIEIEKATSISYTLLFISGFIWLFFCFLFTIPIHEAGHLCGGLLSGYRFLSYRLGRWMIYRKNRKFCFGIFSIPGTGGQCLMMPNTKQGEPFAFRLYLSSGAIANFLCGGILLLFCFFSQSVLLFYLLLLAGICQLIVGIVNLIPLKQFPNDGTNIRSLQKDKAERQALWVTLAIYEQSLHGVSLAEMPDEWFDVPPPSPTDCALLLGLKCSCASRFVACGKYDAALSAYCALLADEIPLVPLQKMECQCESLLLQLCKEGLDKQIKAQFTPELEKYCNMTKAYPSRIALRYVRALLEQNSNTLQQAEHAKKQSEKCYPLQGEWVTYQALIEQAAEQANLTHMKGTF